MKDVTDPAAQSKARDLVLVAAACACAGVMAYSFALLIILPAKRNAQLARYDSGVMALVDDTHEALRVYHADHGRYPPTLHELNYGYHGGGYCDSMLKDVRYQSDGASYTL